MQQRLLAASQHAWLEMLPMLTPAIAIPTIPIG
jgi:hypothetical protein